MTLGCTPGGDCCDSCRNHRAPAATLGAVATGRRNASLRHALGDTVCDQDGNCYTDGVLSSAPLTTGPGCDPGMSNCGGETGGAFQMNNTTTFVVAGVAIIAALEFFTRRR